RNLLEQALPYWNRTAGGQEVPVYIRLDSRPAGPGLSVVHAAGPTPRGPAVRLFGPYLGGDRVRLAVSALHRVLTLAYTGTRLTGSQRDMASTRGVSADDREAMVGTLTAVLSRDPDATAVVGDRLRIRRDEVAGALAFELAARLQAELDALDWITCPQRVTLPEPDDFDACGWAGGVLVRFQMRGGRVRTWTPRACTRARAERYLAATPPDCAGFAHRNAELAARLLP